MKRKIIIIVAVAALAGCANMNKEEIGSAFGAIAGAVIGNKLGGDRGAAIGLMLGGFLGNRLGAQLDEQDKLKLAELEREALETGASGSFVTNKTKARVTVNASATTLDKHQEFALSSTLTAQPLVVIDPVLIEAYVDTPVFNSISEDGKPKMVIQKGVAVRIVANVMNENWAVIGDTNLGIGYVPRRFLNSDIVAQVNAAQLAEETKAKVTKAKTSVPKVAAKKTKQTQLATANAQAPTVSTMTKLQYEQEMSTLNAAYKPRTAAVDATSTTVKAVAPTAPVAMPAVQLVQASTECKVLTRTVETTGSPFTENLKYCKEPPKGWQTQSA